MEEELTLFTQNLYALSVLPFKSSLFVNLFLTVPDSWWCNFVFSIELLILLAKAWDSDAYRVMYRTIPMEVDLSPPNPPPPQKKRTIPMEVDAPPPPPPPQKKMLVFSIALLMIFLAKAWDTDTHRVMYLSPYADRTGTPRQSTEHGTLSGPSWLLPSLAA